MPYTKLDHDIVKSSVWMESHTTLRVWMTLLAIKNRHGEVLGSIPGIANIGRVTIKECETALNIFLAPDPYSRNKDNEGRRIAEIPGGWIILNHEQYKHLDDAEDRREKTAARVRRHRERKERDAQPDLGPIYKSTPSEPVTQKRYRALQVTPGSEMYAHVDVDVDVKNLTTLRRANWLAPFVDAWQAIYGNGSGPAVAGRLGKALKPLVKQHGEEKVLQQLTAYLAATKPQFANPQSFAQRFGGWKAPEKRKTSGQRLAEGSA